MPNPASRGRLTFWGSDAAELFSRELDESFEGVLAHNLIHDPADPMVGFVSASIDGRPWTDTMWTRDAGVFLRELVQWGELETACLAAARLIDLVQTNSEGYNTFPMFFQRGQPGSGSELDGTGAIIIGLVLLWERLPAGHPTREQIAAFLDGPASPLVYILRRLEGHPLIPGSGEFGGGCGIEGDFYNVVQNNLVRLALLAAARLEHTANRHERAANYTRAADQLTANMLRLLRDASGAWLWNICIDTLQPDPAIIYHPINKGFGGLNAVLAMNADVEGLVLTGSDRPDTPASILTFEQLLAFPLRKQEFDRHGAWTQFDEYGNGLMTGPSYGQGYAAQAMLLMDRLDLAGKAVDFLARVTYQPCPGNDLDRWSPYLFYERIYLPELWEQSKASGWTFPMFDGQRFDQGCGALNLVCVAEPLKIARLIAGVDDADPARLRLAPRLLPGWMGFRAENWPVLTTNGVLRLDLTCERQPDGLRLAVKVRDGLIPTLEVRLPAHNGYSRQTASQVKEAVFTRQ
jgi:hypothetical protein